MRFYNRQHRHYCGIDLHVKTMYVCILDATGQVLVHRNVPSTPEALLEVVAPYRDDLVVAAECMFTWYWLADVCAAEGIAFVLGPRARDEGHPRRQGQERQARFVQDREPARAAASCRRPTSTRGDARDAGPHPPSVASGAEARPAAGAHSEHAGAVQPPGLRAAARLSGQSRRACGSTSPIPACARASTSI